MPKVSKMEEHKWCSVFHIDVDGLLQLGRIVLILAVGWGLFILEY